MKNTCINHQSMTFHKEWYELIAMLKSDEERAAACRALVSYGLYGRVDFDLSPDILPILNVVRRSLHQSRVNQLNGKKGGAPVGNKNNPYGRKGKGEQPSEHPSEESSEESTEEPTEKPTEKPTDLAAFHKEIAYILRDKTSHRVNDYVEFPTESELQNILNNFSQDEIRRAAMGLNLSYIPSGSRISLDKELLRKLDLST